MVTVIYFENAVDDAEEYASEPKLERLPLNLLRSLGV